MICKFKKLHADARLPEYKSNGAAGADLYPLLDAPRTLFPLERLAIPTGLAVEVPPGYELQIRTRSGLALNEGLVVMNSPATIDSDYRGEIFVILGNVDDEVKEIKPGERIAQLVLQKVERIEWKEVKELTQTERGSGKFGSTGK